MWFLTISYKSRSTAQGDKLASLKARKEKRRKGFSAPIKVKLYYEKLLVWKTKYNIDFINPLTATDVDKSVYS
jgi:hypothetical protein